MYVVTGGAGFIGSALVWRLNREGIDRILVVDALGTSEKWQNLVRLKYHDYLHKDVFLQQLEENRLGEKIEGIFHLGACSSTTEQDGDYLLENNFHYTQRLAEYSLRNQIRFVYASSGATYGDGRQGYSDNDAISPNLVPLNRYGYSKQLFDLWALRTGAAKKIVGLKFFNVFGPNEYHKGDMASVAYKSFHQIQTTGRVKLFKSYHPDYGDGASLRDFVYVKDCIEVMLWLVNHTHINGIFNLGTGQARSWNDLAHAVFQAMNVPPAIDYVDMPEILRGRYQYFTQAAMEKLRSVGYTREFYSLESAVADYVQNYLAQEVPFLGNESTAN